MSSRAARGILTHTRVWRERVKLRERTKSELGYVCTGAADALRDFDVDGSGTLNLAEFAALTLRLGFSPPPEVHPKADAPHDAVVAAFRRFDVNSTGALSTSELRKGLGKI